MKLEITPYDLETIIRFRESMIHMDLHHRQERELDVFHKRLTDKLIEHGVGGQLIRTLITSSTNCAVTVEIESHDVINYRRVAAQLNEPFPLYDEQPEAYHNQMFNDWIGVTRSWIQQVPDEHQPEDRLPTEALL